MAKRLRYVCAQCRELQELLDAVAHTVECSKCPNRICDHLAKTAPVCPSCKGRAS